MTEQTLALILIFLILLLFYEREIMETMIGFGRGFAGDMGDPHVFPNRFDAAPYGPYPWADPQYS